MAIYRGAGGSGDAVNDAASEVLLALTAKDAAIAAQAAAEAAQVAAQTAETNAETAETNAAASAAAAATFNPTLYVTKASNLSDLASASTSRTNLGLVIGTDVLSPSGSGASLTSLNATNISSGTLASGRLPAFSGDATSTAGTSALTLATVNSNTGSFGSSSSIPVITVNGKGLVTAVTTSAVAPVTGFKNRIINGAMVIDQRNAGASVANIAGLSYSLDRWFLSGTVATKFTVQQNAGAVTPPAGFTKYLGVSSSSAYTVGVAERFQVGQRIEGFNTADLAWGTASASTVTLSFWVRSSLTGTFGGSLQNGGTTRSYPYTYTISSANTWEQKTVTIAGDTSGTWASDNTNGITVAFGLGTGSTYSGTAGAWATADYNNATGATSVVGTNGATFYITGVQLEKGSTATSFDYRPYGTELALCQRYYQLISAYLASTTAYPYSCGTTKRAAPTITSNAANFTLAGVTPSADTFWARDTAAAAQYNIFISIEL